MHGLGVMMWPGNWIFVGEFKDNERHGSGRCEWADAHAPGHVDDFHDADDVQKESPGECDAWIVFDMAFDRDMNAAEHGALSRQVSMCVAANRRARRPFRLAAISTNEEDDDAVNPNDPNDDEMSMASTVFEGDYHSQASTVCMEDWLNENDARIAAHHASERQ